MKAFDLREKYLSFFEKHSHTRISGASLVPENDPTVLFTTAGMHPLVPYIIGQNHPAGTRLVNCQRCIRTGDIDSVGDVSHLTFFEMLGNWSLGDYFKREAIEMSFEFLTSSEYLNIPAKALIITVYEGDKDIPADEESAKIWEELGIDRKNICYLGREHNWWGPPGKTGPCGPDTEMFFDTKYNCDTEQAAFDIKQVGSNSRYLEIWNDVFMQYQKNENGNYDALTRKCVDTGMGLERTTAILQKKESVFDTELFTPILQSLEQVCELRYISCQKGNNVQLSDVQKHANRALRIITDHVRTAVFILGDENAITPSNVGQGYILRRVIRRAIRFGKQIGMTHPFLCDPAETVLSIYSAVYPMLLAARDTILYELRAEEERFLATLQKGEKEFDRYIQQYKKEGKAILSGGDVFHLYDTYGFPKEVTEELAAEKKFTIDHKGFEEAFKVHQNISKNDGNQTFKGGLADSSKATTKLHTVTHLLHQALRDVLGDHVAQKGSNITQERLRFDFLHPEKVTREQLQIIEGIVNTKIQEALPIIVETMSLDEAKQKGARAFFGDKYDEVVTVYSIGDFSKEVCGGPHVGNTKELGVFKIQKEQSSSRGVRRIRAILM